MLDYKVIVDIHQTKFTYALSLILLHVSGYTIKEFLTSPFSLYEISLNSREL